MLAKRGFWLIAFAIISEVFYSQNLSFNFHKLGNEEHLNSLNVFNIQQDENGLIHVTADNGIYLYNGKVFSLLKTDNGKNPTIINSFIKDKSSIYLSTREYGITEVNYKLNQEKNLTSTFTLSTDPDQIIVTDGYIYLLKSDIRLEIIDVKANKLIDDEIKTTNKSNQAFCLYKTKAGKILVGRSDGLYEVIGGKQVKLAFFKNLPAYSLTENNKGELLIGSSSKIYFAKNNTLLKEVVPTYKTKATTFSTGGEKNINKILCDAFDRIWFTSYPNENIYVYSNEITYDVFADLNITPLLINCLYKDRDENIWVGTMDDGIYVFQNTFFNNVTISPEGKDLGVNKALFKDNLVLTATGNGFYAYNIGFNNLKTISAPDNILTEQIYDIKELAGGIYYTKLSQFDLNSTLIVTNNRSYKFKPILGKLIYPLTDGKLILCDWQANVLLCNSDASKVLDTLISFPDFSISINSIYAHNDSLLIATKKGLVYYNFKTKKNTTLADKINHKVNDISIINGKIVVAYDEGIEFLNSNQQIKSLGNKVLNGVKKVRQHQNRIWIVSNGGLFICDSAFTPLKVFNKSNGILSDFINDISFNSKYTCISTSKGISIAETKDLLERSPTIAAVSVDQIKINNAVHYYLEGKTILLSTSDENITIFFNSPNYSKPNTQYFRYQLDNGPWIPIENTSFDVPVLKGGPHKLIIEASSDNINWSPPTLVEFNKKIKLSETAYSFWILLIGSVIFISFISYLIIKRINMRALKRIQEEQQVNLLKHQAMNSLLSPHFIFNSLTSIQNYINSNNSLKASEYLAKFSRLIRMIIEKAALAEIPLRDEITRLTYYLELEKERFKNKFDYTISVDEALDANVVNIPNMIIQPHAENCIIHGILPKLEHGQLNITFKKTSNGKLLITIEDDGIGLIKAKEHSKTGHKSLGTATIKNILELNSKLTGKTQFVTMIDKSTLNTGKNGTIITIELEL